MMDAERKRDWGLLILRVGIGLAFVIHGLPKLMGGPEVWMKLGTDALSPLGLYFMPKVLGCVAALSEFVGGILIAFGFLMRTASLFLFGTMAIATLMHILRGDAFSVYSHALEAAILFFSLMWIGPGTFSIEERWAGKKK